MFSALVPIVVNAAMLLLVYPNRYAVPCKQASKHMVMGVESRQGLLYSEKGANFISFFWYKNVEGHYIVFIPHDILILSEALFNKMKECDFTKFYVKKHQKIKPNTGLGD